MAIRNHSACIAANVVRGDVSGAAPAGAISVESAEALARAVVALPFDAALAIVLECRRRGYGVDDVLLGLLQPAARILGRWWEEDCCSFADVTMGTGTLHRLMAQLSAMRDPAETRPAALPGRCLAASVPGEAHGFGLAMLAELLEQDGWSVERLAGATRAGLVRAVCEEPFDLVCLSAATQEALDRLPALVRLLRNQSCNSGIRILAGGPALLGRGDLARALGADGGGGDGPETVATARLLAPADVESVIFPARHGIPLTLRG
jgi:MerR family transcriptional regulator, light-induced transcriptional regulator